MSPKPVGFLGIQWVSLHAPIGEHKGIFAAFFALFCWGIFPTIVLVSLVGLLLTKYYFITIAYVTWWLYDYKTPERGGRRMDWVRRATVWTWLRDYFPIKFVKTADLNPNSNYLIISHPHGILNLGTIGTFSTEVHRFSELFPGITSRVLSYAGVFWFPFARSYAMAMGHCSASKQSCEYILTKMGKGQAVVLVVGGSREMLDAIPGTLKLNLRNKKGFIKMALKHGVSLVPCLSFGENDMYQQLSLPDDHWFRKLQLAIYNRTGLSCALLNGRGFFQYSFGFLPHQSPMLTVLGKPLEVIRNENPTQEDIDALHGKYIDCLTQLFYDHRHEFAGGKDLELLIY